MDINDARDMVEAAQRFKRIARAADRTLEGKRLAREAEDAFFALLDLWEVAHGPDPRLFESECFHLRDPKSFQ